jgi:hypothetical protein
MSILFSGCFGLWISITMCMYFYFIHRQEGDCTSKQKKKSRAMCVTLVAKQI